MKKIIGLAGLTVAAGAAAAFAGPESIGYVPVDVWVNPEMKTKGDSSSTGALLLLGMLGVVIATSQFGGFASRNATEMLPEEPIDE